jgi:import inner membrane translocase subunit TIM50
LGRVFPTLYCFSRKRFGTKHNFLTRTCFCKLLDRIGSSSSSIVVASLEAWRRWYAGVGEPPKKPLLPDAMLDVVHNRPVRTIVLELDNVLIHTEWDRENGWRFKLRPGMHWFLYRLSQHAGYELVLWTKHPTHIGEHLAVATEKGIVQFSHKLYKESASHSVGEVVKDLGRLNRDLSRVLVIDTSANQYATHAANVLRIPAFKVRVVG